MEALGSLEPFYGKAEDVDATEIRILMEQCGATLEQATSAYERAGRDLAKAVVELVENMCD